LNNRELIVFSSYSYLGLNLREEVLEAKKAALTKFGSGSHAVMLLGGRTNVHVSLKDRLVENFQGDDAILFSSGYSANMGVIDSLMGEDGMIFCDMLVHTSILDGCRISGADVHMFPHQDADALDRMLGRRPAGTPALVIVDGVYSLRGAIANLPNILEVAHKHGALLMVDEAHALGAIGPGGRGTAAHFGLNGKVDITTGGLGKGIPAYGGYVVADRELIDYLRFRSRPYVYSGGMDVANAAAALRAMELMESEPALMDKLNRNIAVMDQALVDAGIPCLRWGSPCMPVVCRNDKEAYALSREMMRRGYYIAPITYPAVPKDQQGLRLTVTAAHEPEQILRVVEELAEVMKSFS
ncbi:MAG: aminotransferase class I/II-fold pyridoxal phosphate-dependent enzyme, partial [Pseudomonadota bacterium]